MQKIQRQVRLNLFTVVVLVLGFFQLNPSAIQATENSQYFPQTGQTVSGKFLEYWKANGGLATYGFPITEAQPEVDPETGKTFLTQWFERNRFELHPENAGTKYEVLLGLLGKDLRREALSVDPDFARADTFYDPGYPKEQQLYFSETGHNLRFGFLKYWQQNGGLEHFGYPIDEEHPEVDPETGKVFMSQWFERARFEYHPENKAPYDILLGLLGNQIKTPRTKLDFVWKLGTAYNELQGATGVAVDKQGNVFVSEGNNNRIRKYDSNKHLLAIWGSKGLGDGQFNDAESLAVDTNGNLYVVDRFNRRIEKFDNSGHFLNKWGTENGQIGLFRDPIAIAVDQQGNVYVTDTGYQIVQKFDSSGHTLALWGVLDRPKAIAVDGHNNVYIIDANVVKKFANDGTLLTKWGVYDDPSMPASLALDLDKQDNVYLASLTGIQKFDGSGQLLCRSGSTGVADGQFANVTGIAVDGQGNIFVSDRNNSRVQKFQQSCEL